MLQNNQTLGFVLFPEDAWTVAWREHEELDTPIQPEPFRKSYTSELALLEMEAPVSKEEMLEEEAIYTLLCFFTGYRSEPMPELEEDFDFEF